MSKIAESGCHNLIAKHDCIRIELKSEILKYQNVMKMNIEEELKVWKQEGKKNESMDQEVRGSNPEN